jgi:hypothetical protein
MSNIQANDLKSKLVWIEPVVEALDLAETEAGPNLGGDGNIHADCTRS